MLYICSTSIILFFLFFVCDKIGVNIFCELQKLEMIEFGARLMLVFKSNTPSSSLQSPFPFRLFLFVTKYRKDISQQKYMYLVISPFTNNK